MDQSSNFSNGSEKSIPSSCDEEDPYDHYQLNGLTTQEVDRCNRMVSPSQRLKRKSSIFSEDGDVMYSGDSATSSSPSTSTTTALDRVKLYVTHHSFFQHQAVIFTSQRRAFERDVYDFARSLHLSSKEARNQVAKARVSYGKDVVSDAEDSAWDGEVDDRAPVCDTADDITSAPLREIQKMTSTRRTNRSNSAGRVGEGPVHDSKRREHRRARRTGEKLPVDADVGRRQSQRKLNSTKAEYDSDHSRNATEPKTQEEAHENYLRSNAKDPGSVLREGQGEEEQEKLQERMADFDAYIRGTRDFATEKQVDQFEHGSMKGASKKAREEIRAKKDEYDTRRNLLQQAERMEAQEIEENGVKQRKKGKERRIHDGFSPSDEAASVTATAEGMSTALGLDQARPCHQHPVPPPMLDDDVGPISPSATTTPRKRKRPTSSPYFPPSAQGGKLVTRKNISCIPFPPLTSERFGLMQERLADDPFRLLIAVIFLNKTRGAVAMPVFYALMERYPSVEALAEAKHDDVVQHIQHLGLQNQRAKKIVSMAQAWLACPPEKGKRYRCLHYPRKGDGSDVKPGEVLEDESKDPRVAWEIAHLPGLGAYAFDSWRIFCRDRLRGMDVSLDEETTLGEPGADQGEGQPPPEWTQVVPTDKELRAYLRWRWLKAGWAWDPLTGRRERATEQQLKEADGGGVMIEQQDNATDTIKE